MIILITNSKLAYAIPWEPLASENKECPMHLQNRNFFWASKMPHFKKRLLWLLWIQCVHYWKGSLCRMLKRSSDFHLKQWRHLASTSSPNYLPKLLYTTLGDPRRPFSLHNLIMPNIVPSLYPPSLMHEFLCILEVLFFNKKSLSQTCIFNKFSFMSKDQSRVKKYSYNKNVRSLLNIWICIKIYLEFLNKNFLGKQ